MGKKGLHRKRYWTTVGIEFTFLTPKGAWEPKYVGRFRSLGYKRAYNDGDRVLEVPSPVFRTRESLKSFYKRLRQAANSYKLVTHEDSPEHTEGNGGGHVHIGIPKMDRQLLAMWNLNMTTDITNRPYLCWIFNQWCDDTEANSILGYKSEEVIDYGLSEIEKISILNKHPRYKPIPYRSNDGYFSNQGITGNGTFEFRFFDAPATWQDVENHVDFALAYAKHVLKVSNKFELIPLEVRSMQKVRGFSKEKAWNEFNNLLDILKLDKKRYKKYYKNLDERFLYGKRN